MASTAHMTFIGRAHLLAKCRAAVESGQNVWLLGEHGVGKSALAKRIHPDALYLASVTPVKDLLTCLLTELYQRGWWSGPPSKNGEDDRELSGDEVERGTRRLDAKTATSCALCALKEREAIPGQTHYKVRTVIHRVQPENLPLFWSGFGEQCGWFASNLQGR